MAKASEMKRINNNENGEAYYCTECKRNHTKGKIYKEHLEFARNTEKEEDINKFDNLELNEDAYIDEEDIEEDLELEEEVDDIENEGEDDADFEQDILNKDAQTCVEAVKKLPGVGDATLKKLIEAGFNSLESIAYTPPSIIQEES
ncbi:MAG: hypothetical protein ACFFFB_26745, partial [Candidatus Heimdallarchaeota archaeon]